MFPYYPVFQKHISDHHNNYEKARDPHFHMPGILVMLYSQDDWIALRRNQSFVDAKHPQGRADLSVRL